jgi:hypothetical protein
MILRHCRLANEADSPTSGARGGLSIRPLDSQIKQVVCITYSIRLLLPSLLNASQLVQSKACFLAESAEDNGWDMPTRMTTVRHFRRTQ